MKQRRMIVTDALPYANGALHLGHILGYVQSDIWSRFQKLRGHECYYICGSDAHGTPIMLKAEAEGISPQQLVQQTSQQHLQDFNDFLIVFDHFHSTHDPINRDLVSTIYKKIKANGDIDQRMITQAFDVKKQMFLPDRFIKGTCPRCHAPDQYGDSCEICGATYAPTDLIDPISAISGTKPTKKTSQHCFFKLSHYQSILKKWMQQGHLQPEIVNKLQEWFTVGLQDWNISRDKPYFGFEIPGETDKYFYVWLDAPIGYIANFKILCDHKSEIVFDDFWYSETDTELHHFVGKDIIYFHALFWPAILKAAGYRMPTHVHAHGFLTINGQKMSKSRGTFVQARHYLQHLNPELLRYYFAAKLGTGIEDIDLDPQDFMLRINADLVGKFVNIASRCARFINKNFDNTLANTLMDQALFDVVAQSGEVIADHYETKSFVKAMRTIMQLADQANQFIEQHQPWVLIKSDSTQPQAQAVCTMGLNLFKQLMVYLQPVLPNMADHVCDFFNLPTLTWQDSQQPLLAHQIKPFKPLVSRVTAEQIALLGQQQS